MSDKESRLAVPSQPSRIDEQLSVREARFVDLYLGETRGNGRQAAHLAGYRGSPAVLDVQASRLLRRPRVREAIQRTLRYQGERVGLTKDWLVQQILEVMAERRPFERLKAAELLAKLMRWFDAEGKGADNLLGSRTADGYEALAETLEGHAAGFSAEQREAFRQDLLRVIAEATRALKALDAVG
ncbi:MAG: terminase small subunit [Armatimonadota bacterium]|nr:terminase small subunit [Armatimonadota bacterium]